jgi:pilus assembly protein Flp/PilA
MIAAEIDQFRRSGTPRSQEGIQGVPSFVASTEVDFPSSTTSLNGSRNSCARRRAPEQLKGGESLMAFSQWINYFRARFESEEGQTMAEYGVVLAVIALGVLVAFTALSGGITNAINNVTSILG